MTTSAPRVPRFARWLKWHLPALDRAVTVRVRPLHLLWLLAGPLHRWAVRRVDRWHAARWLPLALVVALAGCRSPAPPREADPLLPPPHPAAAPHPFAPYREVGQ